MAGDLAAGMLAMIGQRPAGTEAQRLTALAVCDRAGDGLDVQDPVQRREAAGLARPLLDALGLLGDIQPPAKLNTVAYTHGSQSGVDHHLAAGHRTLCKACQRWADVHADRPPGCGEWCGSVTGYWRHRNAKEKTCAVSRAAYRVHLRERDALGPAAR
jgi:hypothetical protein